jgi:membrane protein implicated in regulation of membrane protease activity
MAMIYYLNELSYWHWLGFGIILLVLEFLLRGNGFLLWLALVACIVGLLVWLFPLLAWPYQLLIFSLGGIVCLVSWWMYLLRNTGRDIRKR